MSNTREEGLEVLPEADAIVDDTFMLFTHPEVRDVLVERASDWNAFIRRQTDTVGR